MTKKLKTNDVSNLLGVSKRHARRLIVANDPRLQPFDRVQHERCNRRRAREALGRFLKDVNRAILRLKAELALDHSTLERPLLERVEEMAHPLAVLRIISMDSDDDSDSDSDDDPRRIIQGSPR
jgi:hypothetical protein